MKNLFEAVTVGHVKERLGKLRPDSKPLWGKMDVAQAVAHCAAAMEWAVGLQLPPRRLVGLLFGRFAKVMIVKEIPMPRNSRTDRRLLVKDKRDFEVERQRLGELIDRFVTAGPAGCTTHPHSLFGKLTPTEWAALMYQHLDHHLRQFQV